MTRPTHGQTSDGHDLAATLLAADWTLGGDGTGPVAASPGIDLTSVIAAKVVTKHWGQERWLVHEDAPFAVKLIHLRQGTRTSLQLHREKLEVSLVLAGEAALVYKPGVTKGLDRHLVGPGAVVRVWPGTPHRLEALTDVVLIEASTPQLDDVVRLSDDWDRPDGRIESEHAAEGKTPT